MPTTRTEPRMSVLVDGTVPEYSSGTPDNGQTIYPCCLVYKSGTAPDPEFTVCPQYYGASSNAAAVDEATIYIVEIPPSHPSFPQAYTLDTAFTAETDTMTVHRISLGDRFWVWATDGTNGATLSVNETDWLICENGGLVEQGAAATTPTKWGVHAFRPIHGPYSSATYLMVEYIGRMSLDHA